MGTCGENCSAGKIQRTVLESWAPSTQQAFIEGLPCDRYCGGCKVENRVPVSVRTLHVASYRELGSNLISNSSGPCKWKFRGRQARLQGWINSVAPGSSPLCGLALSSSWLPTLWQRALLDTRIYKREESFYGGSLLKAKTLLSQKHLAEFT